MRPQNPPIMVSLKQGRKGVENALAGGTGKDPKEVYHLGSCKFSSCFVIFCHVKQKEVIPIGHPQIPKTTRGVDPPVNTKPFLRGNDFTGFPLVDEICSKNSDDGDSQHVVV